MGNFARAGKEGEGSRAGGLAMGLIEIDAVEIFGFLSGSRLGLRERERKKGSEREERREEKGEFLVKVAPWDVYSPESALNRGSPIWKADKVVSPGMRAAFRLSFYR